MLLSAKVLSQLTHTPRLNEILERREQKDGLVSKVLALQTQGPESDSVSTI